MTASTVAAEGREHILTIDDLRKTYSTDQKNRLTALRGVSLAVEQGEFFTLLGPSGCGKTTLLRCIAGLEHPDSGQVKLRDRVLFSSGQKVDVPVNQRGLSMVFQSYAIWPHMNVAANVAFPLRVLPRRLRPSRAEIDRKVDEALEKVRLSDAKKRRATDLSGGQQQRLAVARALVTDAPLTLFDEPLSNLDAKLRDGMRFELKRLQRELGITAVYVTHDQAEALSMSNRIAVMRGGVIEQLDRPRDLYERPQSLFVADFIGTSNIFVGTVVGTSSVGYLVDTPLGRLWASTDGPTEAAEGTQVTVAIRPQNIEMTKEPAAMADIGAWPGIVRNRAYLGESVDHLVEVGGRELRVRVDPRLSLAPGTEVTLRLEAWACSMFPASGAWDSR